MKNKFFYSHIVEITEVTVRINELDLTEDEKNHLMSLLEANIHSTVIENILSQLQEDDKKQFLKNLVANNNQIILEHLKIKIEKLEDKIKNSVEELKKDLLKDLEDVREN